MKVIISLNCLKNLHALALTEMEEAAVPLSNGDYMIDISHDTMERVLKHRLDDESMGATIERLCEAQLRQAH